MSKSTSHHVGRSARGAAPAGDADEPVAVRSTSSGKAPRRTCCGRVFGIPHIATGDMLRAEIQPHASCRKPAHPAAGQYVPDDIMIGMIRTACGNGLCRGFIIDGFPAHVPQAERSTSSCGSCSITRPCALPQGRVAELLSASQASGLPTARARTLPRTAASRSTTSLWSSVRMTKPRRPAANESTSPRPSPCWSTTAAGIVSEIDGRGHIDQYTGRVLNAIGENGRFGSISFLSWINLRSAEIDLMAGPQAAASVLPPLEEACKPGVRPRTWTESQSGRSSIRVLGYTASESICVSIND